MLAAAALPLVSLRAHAQAKVARVGMLIWDPAKEVEYLRAGLTEVGMIEGKNLQLDIRTAQGKPALLPQLASELARSNPDVIVAVKTPAILAAREAAKNFPIIMAPAGDALGTGLVQSLARPGGNITGVSAASPESAMKSLELMREIIPNLRRVAILLNLPDPFNKPLHEHVREAAAALSIELVPVGVRSSDELEAAIATAAKEKANAILIQPSLPQKTAQLALKHRLPSTAGNSAWGDAGCLMTYSADMRDIQRKVATYIQRIVQGAKPADLPVQLPTKFEVVINQRTARALGITVPQPVLLRADRLIS